MSPPHQTGAGKDRSSPCYDAGMSPEAFTIIGTGIALAALNVGLIAWLRSDMRRIETDFKAGQNRIGADFKAGQNRVEDRLVAVEKEQARTAGLLEGFGLTGRADPAPEAGA